MDNNEHSFTGLEVAVIGMAGKFPGAKNLTEFWENLSNGVESISFFSSQELEEVGIEAETLQNQNYIKAKGYLENIECFDAPFFGYKPLEAEYMDPQLRLFHECAWIALEDAGYNPLRCKGLIGLYSGAAPHFDWETLCLYGSTLQSTERFMVLQMINKDYLSTIVSYRLNLKGPSITIDTACSTSSVAIHLACQALLSGECDIALAGGVSVSIYPKSGYYYIPGLLYSGDGHCRSFDAKASGTVFGNGVGIAILKSLEDALADRDTIYAIIKGTAITNDGNRKVGFSASSAKGQAETIRSAYNVSEVPPETIGYIETHGTATPHGDPIEIEALTLALDIDKKQHCPIGSVKSNVGHLYAAAGVVSFIKVVLMLNHRLIPPSINFETANPGIDFENTPFYVNTRLQLWEKKNLPLRAGVSTFGVGGTNAHIILEEAPILEKGEAFLSSNARGYHLLLLSAKTETSLERMTMNLNEYFKTHPNVNLADAVYTLQEGREAFPFRRFLVCTDINDVVAGLSRESGRLETFHSQMGNPPVVFMFSGQGSQYVNMGRELYEKEPMFREEMDQCFKILNTLMGYDLKEILYPRDSSDEAGEENVAPDPGKEGDVFDINQTEIAQPVLFAIEYALARLLMGWGINPDIMIGHSIGEYTAACLSGVYSLEDTLKIVVARGKCMQQAAPGKMLSIKLPEEQVMLLLTGQEEVELAAVNSSSLCTVSGPGTAIENFTGRLEEKGCQYRLLHTSHAFHSRSMDPILDTFSQQVTRIPPQPPTIPYISNLTGNLINMNDLEDSRYWVNHLRRPVRFANGLTRLLKEPDTLLVELGPGRTLSTFVHQHSQFTANHQVLNLLRHPGEEVPDHKYLLNKAGQLWIYGRNIDWEVFHPGNNGRYRISLPHYAFDTHRYSENIDKYKKYIKSQKVSVERGDKREKTTDWFYRPLWKPVAARTGPGSRQIPANSVWIVFMDSCAFGDKLVDYLEKQDQEVIVVKSGQAFEKLSDHHYVIHPLQADDYTALLKDISSSREQTGQVHILHAWGITGTVDRGSPLSSPQQGTALYYFYLVWLAQALDKEGFKQSIQLTVLSDHLQPVTGQEQLDPYKSLLLAPVRVIPQEYPHISCRSIDILLPESKSHREQELVEHVITECTGQWPEPVVAFRSGLRWIPAYEPVILEKSDFKRFPLKEKGVWLVTGGLGRVAMAVAKKLAAYTKARLILVSRRQFPGEEQWKEWIDSHGTADKTSLKIQQLLEIKKLGGQILMCSADVSNAGQMQQVIRQGEEQFGPINAVIHAAGIIDYSTFTSIGNTSEKICEEQFKAKIHGLTVLDELLKDHKLELCLLTSSLVTIAGGKGYGTYAAANLFMDAVATLHHRTKHQHWLSVNLDLWQSGSSSPRILNEKRGANALLRAMAWSAGNRLIISLEDLHQRVKEWNSPTPASPTTRTNEKKPGKTTPSASRKLQPRPRLSTAYVEPQTPMEKKIARVTQEFLGIEHVGIHDNFFDLGASSLDLVQLGGKLNAAMKKEIPVTELFRYPNIDMLAKYLAEGDSKAVEEKEEKRIEDITKGRQTMQERLKLVKEGDFDE